MLQSVQTTKPMSLRFFHISIKVWFVSLLFAQGIFVGYLAFGYGLASVQQQLEMWNNFNDTAFVAGDTLGNVFYGLHVLLAIVMIAGGSLQLMPRIRNTYQRFHRINGRIYVALACTVSFAGMYLILIRGTVGNVFLHSMTFFSGVVVIVASVLAVTAIRKKAVTQHQAWATRLFLAANGVLFFRLFIFSWFIVFGSLGVNLNDFTGPTVYTVSVFSYLMPLIVFEWFRFVEKRNSPIHYWLLGGLLMTVACVFMLGLIGITMGNWYPSLIK